VNLLECRKLVVPLALLLLAGGVVTSCRSGRRARGPSDVAVLQPAIPTPEPVPIETPEATPTPVQVVTGLELADRAFEAGDYEAARAGYEAHLAGLEGAVDADRVLYRLAILNLARNGGAQSSAAGYALLRRIVKEHPDSPYRMEAELILGLSSRVDGLEVEVEKLEGQLEALKRIDLGRSQGRSP
jgi:hypothetical protein